MYIRLQLLSCLHNELHTNEVWLIHLFDELYDDRRVFICLYAKLLASIWYFCVDDTCIVSASCSSFLEKNPFFIYAN